MHPTEYQKIFDFEADHWWFAGRRKLLHHLLDTHVPDRSARILDAGCGTGHHLLFLKSLGYEDASGTDFSPIAVSFCRKLGLTSVTRGDATSLDYPDGHFDAVLALDVLEHLEDDEAALAEFRRVLRPSGIVILTVPAFRALWSRHDEVLEHYRRYRFGELRPVARRFRYSIREWSYFYSTIFPLVAAIRLASRLLPSRRTSDLETVPRPINRALTWIGALEVRALRRVRLRFGTSLCVVLEKEEEAAAAEEVREPMVRLGRPVAHHLEAPGSLG